MGGACLVGSVWFGGFGGFGGYLLGYWVTGLLLGG